MFTKHIQSNVWQLVFHSYTSSNWPSPKLYQKKKRERDWEIKYLTVKTLSSSISSTSCWFIIFLTKPMLSPGSPHAILVFRMDPEILLILILGLVTKPFLIPLQSMLSSSLPCPLGMSQHTPVRLASLLPSSPHTPHFSPQPRSH